MNIFQLILNMADFNLYLGNFGVLKSPPQEMFTIKHFLCKFIELVDSVQRSTQTFGLVTLRLSKGQSLPPKTAIEGLEASIVREVAIRQHPVHMFVQDQIGDHIETVQFCIRYDFVRISCYIQSNWLYNTTIVSVYF